MKGPSAATLYGTDAANGVIVITTKKGRDGHRALERRTPKAASSTTETGTPTTTRSPGQARPARSWCCRASARSSWSRSGRAVKSDGTKGYDSLRVYSPIKDPDRHAARLRLSQRRKACRCPAERDAIRYFMSAGRDDEIGVFKLDPYEKNRTTRSASRSTRGRCVRTRAC